ncbi:hypothetical protein SAMN05444410_110116 [Hydrobacter penzbergensis]|uniref:RES domain-containing protein n=1 Tax=Hydrobacter penzbergensis TaxID=1235997 RepID=A0A8X8LBZ5_9BACT|nr:hypothetical protein [Hydrobacter penzbergensis]SDX19630.1 hypothetical protein SAMN05444410_110116 [Hydrobacter penzbergensis]
MIDLDSFKMEVKLLAQREENMLALKKAISKFYCNIGVPMLESHHPFMIRARYNSINENGFGLFNKKSQVSYNPFPDLIKLQRANFNGEQVFYGSMPLEDNGNHAAITALMEVGFEYAKDKTRMREYFTVCRWQINKPLALMNLPFSRTAIQKNSQMEEAANEQRNLIVQHFEQEGLINPDSHVQALEFISDCFCERTDKEVYYRITATYCHFIRDWLKKNNVHFDGFLYPSANTEATGVNVALNKTLVDDNILQLDYVKLMCLIRNPSDPKAMNFAPASEDVFPDENGNFNIVSIY